MKQSGLVSAGVLSAITASLCCITPLLALISGTSGAASNFSWMEPARPYLIGVTALVLGFAWYQKLKPVKIETDDCGCEPKKLSFWQSKLFLGIVTIFSIVMLAIPYYSHLFYSDDNKNHVATDNAKVQIVEVQVSGMTCESCEDHIKHEVDKLSGIVSTTVSYEVGLAVVEFDSAMVTTDKIVEAVNSTGYTAIHTTIKK